MSEITPEEAPDTPVQIDAPPEEDYAPEDIPSFPPEDPVPENEVHPDAQEAP